MKIRHVLSFALLGAAAAALGGCPIYPSDRDHRVCVNGTCHDCPDPYYTSSCNDWVCRTSSECPSGYECNSQRRCQLNDGQTQPPAPSNVCSRPSDCPADQNCGADNRCHAGDCSTTGCPSAFVCKLSNGVAKCESVGSGPAPACRSDKDCPSPAGSKCLSGACVAPADQCVDATQCLGGQCVEGVCTPSCDANKPCPTGYACDTAKGVCTGNAGPCTSNAQCGGNTTCVQEHCVDKCGPGATCSAGLVCIDGGCMPDQRPVFTCANEGKQDACAQGSICLRHSCYIACDADAGADACRTSDTFNVCKPVTTGTGTFNVCGSDSNLGTECDVAAGRACASPLVCIDGFCR